MNNAIFFTKYDKQMMPTKRHFITVKANNPYDLMLKTSNVRLQLLDFRCFDVEVYHLFDDFLPEFGTAYDLNQLVS
jgi:hypothetical protein